MIEQRSKLEKAIGCLLGFCLCAAIQVAAQGQRGGGGGGFGGFGGGGQGGGRALGTGSTANRPYYNNGTVGEAMISSDPETRRLIVITDDETGQYVSQVITNLDRPQPQVLIKVVFLEVTRNDSLDIGIEGGFQRRFGNSNTGTVVNAFGFSPLNLGSGNTNNVFGQPTQLFNPAPPGAGLYQIMGTDYQATLRAIAQAGRTEVLSRPSILARNNQPATITVGQSVPLVTSVSYNGVAGVPVSSIAYTSVGIILRVTPFINSEGMVEMIVSPQISELSDRSQWVTVSSGGVQAPVINMRSADTVVVTPDGQPVIIGGLMERTKAQADSKIPILGDIPILGNLFKHKNRSEAKTELIIFLTPRIVMAPSQLAGLTATERSKAELAPKAFTEQELDRFIDGLPKKPAPAETQPGKNNSPRNRQ